MEVTDVEVTELPAMRRAYVRADMSRPGDAWNEISAMPGIPEAMARPDITVASAFPTDALTKGQSADLFYDASLVLPEGAEAPAGLPEERSEGGRFVRWGYTGPYDNMGDAWGAFTSWFATSGHEAAPGLCFEMYRNDPRDTAPADLRTDLYIPIA